MHPSSYDKMAEFCRDYLEARRNERLMIVDLGSCDINGAYHSIFSREPWRYIGVDLVEGPNVDLVLRHPYDWRELATDSIDVVISGQTLEHTEFFWETMAEIARVLKPGGLCCLIAPSSGPRHRFPRDCWRIFDDGFAAVARYANLEVLEAKTQLQDLAGYDNESNKWHESILIARKPAHPFRLRAQLAFFRWLKRRFQPPAGPAETIVEIFPMLGGVLREEDSLFTRFAPDAWREVKFQLPPGAAGGPLRIDFVTPFAVVDLGRLRLKVNGNTIYDAAADHRFGRIRLAGDAERVPNEKYLRVRVVGIDPQLHLPMVTVPPQETLEVQLRLRAHTPHRLT